MKYINYTNPYSNVINSLDHIFDLSTRSSDYINYFFDGLLSQNHICEYSAVEVNEDENNYYARFKLPGLSKNMVDIKLENTVMSILIKESKSIKNEINQSRLFRTVKLPDDVDLEHVSAVMKDGILAVTLPRVESSKPRKIKIS